VPGLGDTEPLTSKGSGGKGGDGNFHSLPRNSGGNKTASGAGSIVIEDSDSSAVRHKEISHEDLYLILTDQ
jgi:hypothetical protein